MDVPQPSLPEPAGPTKIPPRVDPRLEPTPDYGPGSDIAAGGTDSGQRPRTASRFALLFSIAIGVLLAILTTSIGNARSRWPRFARLFRGEAVSSPPLAATSSSQLDHLKPQKQAEALLELAVGRSEGAVDQISSRVDGWQGKLKWDSQMATLTSAALNSSDMRVRESGIQVELAAYGLSKNSASLDYLLKSAEAPDHAQRVWGLWALGLMGNRGVETAQVVQVLTAHLKDSDEDSRHWAVEGLALVGASDTIPVLLETMHDDASPRVREEAACALAQSGMFTREQRWSAIPKLLNYTDDPSLDTQTHAWAFQVLTDITGQRLPNDSRAWRSWYENRSEP